MRKTANVETEGRESMDQLVERALRDAVAKTKRNTLRHGDRFPYITEGQRYDWRDDNNEWIEGFYAGLAWLGFEYEGDAALGDAARRLTARLVERMVAHRAMGHHDIGFLYSLSTKAEWIVDGAAAARGRTVQAADVLMERWRAGGRYLQAWGEEGHAEHGGRIIIDCLMNLPLLFWASETTGNARYREAAEIQAARSLKYLMRGDGSSYHTFRFDPVTGEPIRGETHQGYRDGSTWARGQAWAVYGFALVYRYTGERRYLDAAVRAAAYFLSRLPDDGVPHWDFDAPKHGLSNRDSSASAIALCGLLELGQLLEPSAPERESFREASERLLRALIVACSTLDDPDAEGLLRHGAYNVLAGKGPDDYMIWGDYFYVEALMRVAKGVPGYWYERKRDV
ncbi:glycoside hydrolase family 88 protein [Paenibacillus sp.]|uniref:glycoside hydrolase family 88 protein n=1 Tax=Paenibacillus sp. TaxID=58172 RepID=UPI002D51F94A|nr:glycoside hydrolase family 88 protein [Paenibacillus sp.]HZG58762.1 glycoside hydrolase family 88 protein [Paenibacillus sp.]